jgi:HK97 family phage portal protein
MTQATSNKGPVVLDELTTYAPLELNSDVSKLLSSTDWTSKQIAKVYNIPDSYLNGQGDQQSSLSMIEGMYANSLNRYAQTIASELNEKFSAAIEIDIQPAIDQDRSSYLAAIGGAVKNGALSGNQSDFLLRRVGFLPADTPKYMPAKSDLKGGDTNGSNGTD